MSDAAIDTEMAISFSACVFMITLLCGMAARIVMRVLRGDK
jgi:hypothetical protein